MSRLTRSEVDLIVYACRQAGDDSTYAIVNAALAAVHEQSASTEHSPTCPHFCAACATPPAAIPAAKDEPAELVEKYLANIIDRAPDPLRRLGEYLSRHLNEDEWPTAEALILGAQEAALAQPAPVQQSAPYAWAVTALRTPFYGEFAEQDARSEARRVGGDAEAFPLYRAAPVQQEAVEACDHEWIPLRNEKITSGEICAKLCGATRREGDSQ